MRAVKFGPRLLPATLARASSPQNGEGEIVSCAKSKSVPVLASSFLLEPCLSLVLYSSKRLWQAKISLVGLILVRFDIQVSADIK